MRHFDFKSILLITMTSVAFAGPSWAADVYPADLAKQEPKLAKAFSELTKPLAEKHNWIADFGVSTPVEDITLNDEPFIRLSGCKPHDCPSEKYVVLVSKKDHRAMGAFLVNEVSAEGALSQSSIQWLGQPADDALAPLAAGLFPAADN